VLALTSNFEKVYPLLFFATWSAAGPMISAMRIGFSGTRGANKENSSAGVPSRSAIMAAATGAQ
jgi:hypothetical protein